MRNSKFTFLEPIVGKETQTPVRGLPPYPKSPHRGSDLHPETNQPDIGRTIGKVCIQNNPSIASEDPCTGLWIVKTKGGYRAGKVILPYKKIAFQNSLLVQPDLREKAKSLLIEVEAMGILPSFLIWLHKKFAYNSVIPRKGKMNSLPRLLLFLQQSFNRIPFLPFGNRRGNFLRIGRNFPLSSGRGNFLSTGRCNFLP
jgi:hypothetical protein